MAKESVFHFWGIDSYEADTTNPDDDDDHQNDGCRGDLQLHVSFRP
jgi:hypothetical protein